MIDDIKVTAIERDNFFVIIIQALVLVKLPGSASATLLLTFFLILEPFLSMAVISLALLVVFQNLVYFRNFTELLNGFWIVGLVGVQGNCQLFESFSDFFGGGARVDTELVIIFDVLSG